MIHFTGTYLHRRIKLNNNSFVANKLSLSTDKTCYVVCPSYTSSFVKVYVNNVEILVSWSCY